MLIEPRKVQQIIGFLFLLLYSSFALAQEVSILERDIISYGQPSQEELETFFSDGVQVVIDLRGSNENRGYDEEGFMQSTSVPYHLLPIVNEADVSYDNARIIQDLIANSEGKVLIHCGSGNRVGAMVALIARLEGMDPESALALGEEKKLSSLRPLIIELLNMTVE